jgi:hypothetical protein
MHHSAMVANRISSSPSPVNWIAMELVVALWSYALSAERGMIYPSFMLVFDVVVLVIRQCAHVCFRLVQQPISDALLEK